MTLELYLEVGDRVEVLPADGAHKNEWENLGPGAHLGRSIVTSPGGTEEGLQLLLLSTWVLVTRRRLSSTGHASLDHCHPVKWVRLVWQMGELVVKQLSQSEGTPPGLSPPPQFLLEPLLPLQGPAAPWEPSGHWLCPSCHTPSQLTLSVPTHHEGLAHPPTLHPSVQIRPCEVSIYVGWPGPPSSPLLALLLQPRCPPQPHGACHSSLSVPAPSFPPQLPPPPSSVSEDALKKGCWTNEQSLVLQGGAHMPPLLRTNLCVSPAPASVPPPPSAHTLQSLPCTYGGVSVGLGCPPAPF